MEVLQRIDSAEAPIEYRGKCLRCGSDMRPVNGDEMLELGFTQSDFH